MDEFTNARREGLARRNFLLGSAAAAAAMLPGAALAQSALGDLLNAPSRGNWGDQFDTRAVNSRDVTSVSPVLSQNTLQAMQISIDSYTNLARNGGWPMVPQTGVLRTGVQHPAVQVLRQRLYAEGDLPESAGSSPAFDSYVEAATKRFQARYGLPADGVVGETTLKAMNVPIELRIGQLRTNYNRLVEKVGQDLGQRHVMVNIPAAAIEGVENGQVALRHAAIVGKTDRQTPILDSRITNLNLNPYWHAPASIVRKDIIPLMRKDPTYLERNRIHIFDGNGNEIPPASVDWNTEEAVRYLFRQEPGENNAMASVKINFPNQHAVYMHDTPQQSLFSQLLRFESSGCVRVQNVRDLIVWLSRDVPGWDRQRIEQVINARERVDINLEQPVPVYFVYISAWATRPNVVQFRDDIYHLDGAEELALSELQTVAYSQGQENPYARGDDTF